MASKRRINVNDYELSTTLGTGKYLFNLTQQVPLVESGYQEIRKQENIML